MSPKGVKGVGASNPKMVAELNDALPLPETAGDFDKVWDDDKGWVIKRRKPFDGRMPPVRGAKGLKRPVARKAKTRRGPLVSAKIKALQKQLSELEGEETDDEESAEGDSVVDVEVDGDEVGRERALAAVAKHVAESELTPGVQQESALTQEAQQESELAPKVQRGNGKGKLVDPVMPEDLSASWSVAMKEVKFWYSTFQAEGHSESVLAQSLLSKLAAKDRGLVLENVDDEMSVNIIMEVLGRRYGRDQYLVRRDALSQLEHHVRKNNEPLKAYLQANQDLFVKARNAGAKISDEAGMRLLESAKVELAVKALVLNKKAEMKEPGQWGGLDDERMSYQEMYRELWRYSLMDEQDRGGGEKNKETVNFAGAGGKGKGKGGKFRKNKFNKKLQKQVQTVATLQAKVDELQMGNTWGGGGGGDKGKGKGKGDRKFSPKPGDWECPNPSCKANVFASRDDCFKCHTKKTSSVKVQGKGSQVKDESGGKGVCRFFAQGKCTRGSACQFLHPGGEGTSTRK